MSGSVRKTVEGISKVWTDEPRIGTTSEFAFQESIQPVISVGADETFEDRFLGGTTNLINPAFGDGPVFIFGYGGIGFPVTFPPKPLVFYVQRATLYFEPTGAQANDSRIYAGVRVPTGFPVPMTALTPIRLEDQPPIQWFSAGITGALGMISGGVLQFGIVVGHLDSRDTGGAADRVVSRTIDFGSPGIAVRPPEMFYFGTNWFNAASNYQASILFRAHYPRS